MNLKLNNKDFYGFSDFSLTLNYGAVASAFSLGLYFDPYNADHKKLLRPGAYTEARVEHNGELLITGPLLSPTFTDSPAKQLVKIGGYSRPGVLEDCEPPLSIYPLEFQKLSLREIADKLLAPFQLSYTYTNTVAAEMNEVYETVDAKNTQSVKAFLSELAAQKNIVISHTPAGQLLFTRARTDRTPIIDLDNGGMPGTEISLSFNGQAMHHEITVFKEAAADAGNAGEATISNPYVSAYRPKVMVQSSGTDVDTSLAAKTALAAQLKNIKLTVQTDRWEVNGAVIKPNNIISVRSPELFLYNKTRWFIESVALKGNEKQTTATLTCVLPEVYSGETPKNIFE